MSAPGVQGGDAAGGQAGGTGDKAQETALVGRVQLADHLQEVPDCRALLCVPARNKHSPRQTARPSVPLISVCQTERDMSNLAKVYKLTCKSSKSRDCWQSPTT